MWILIVPDNFDETLKQLNMVAIHKIKKYFNKH